MSLTIVLPMRGTLCFDELAGSVAKTLLRHERDGRKVDSWEIVPSLPPWEMSLIRGMVSDILCPVESLLGN